MRPEVLEYHTGSAGEWVVEHSITEGGDSGGPWFWNRNAYGIHKGLIYDGGPSYFTSVDPAYSPWGSGWSVWTRH
ncbi:hypothetical protein GCM10009525_51850 [Streptosporangium amethystogenes subsp. fukuiense]